MKNNGSSDSRPTTCGAFIRPRGVLRLLLTAFAAATFVQPVLGPSLAQESKSAVTPPQEQAKSNPLKQITDRMHSAQLRLHRGDAGEGTRALQERVVGDLQALIDSAKQSSNHQSAQSQSEAREQTSAEKSQAEERENRDSNSRPTGGPDDKNAGRPGPTPKQRIASSPAAHRPLIREVWGHLPPALRERVPADFSETILPDYDDLVRRYFEAILDEASSSNSKRAAQ